MHHTTSRRAARNLPAGALSPRVVLLAVISFGLLMVISGPPAATPLMAAAALMVRYRSDPQTTSEGGTRYA